MRSLRPLAALALLAACSESGTPKLEVTPERITFLNTEIGTSSKRTIKLTNAGTGKLQLSQIAIDTQSPELILEPPSIAELGPAEATSAVITYTPAAEGIDEGTLIVAANDSAGERRIPISAAGVTVGFNILLDSGGECSGAPGSMSFGRPMVGAPVERTIRFESLGSGSVYVRAAIDRAMTEWSIAPDPFQMIVPGGTTAELKITYDPRDAIDDAATLEITTSAATMPELSIPLCGAAELAALCASPRGVSFHDIAAATSTSATITLESCGNLPLAISAIEMANDAMHPADPAIVLRSTPALPVVLDPGMKTTMTVEFGAADVDPHEAFVRVASSANLEPEIFINVGANKPSPCNLVVAPDRVEFHGGMRTERRVIIGNDGPADCQITSGNVTSGQNRYSLAARPSLPLRLKQGEAASWVIAYAPGPMSAWPEYGWLEIEQYADRRAELMRIPLTGNRPAGDTCRLEPNPGGVYFGSIEAGKAVEESIALANVSLGTCEVLSIGLQAGGDPSLVYLGPAGPETLQPGDTLSLPVVYHPLFAGRGRGDLVYQLANVSGPTKLPLFGLAREATPPACLGEGCNCMPGQTQTYRRYDQRGSSSGVVDGGQDTPFHLTCDEMSCPMGKISVETAPEVFSCMDPPPVCGRGEGLELDSNHHFKCVDCDVIVQYGFLFDGLRVCAPAPRVSCSQPGTVPTFSAQTRRWECITTCNNGLYDQRQYDGTLVCVPC